MGAAQITTIVPINPNVRNAYTTGLLDMAGWWFYENFNFARQQTGVSVKWTCDGTTGPSGAGDTTNRLTDKTKCQTRATVAAAAQSYGVLNFTDFQLMFCSQGSTDDKIRISVSPGKLFTLAGTTTNQPTAADELIISTGQSIVDPNTSLDRVMSIWALGSTGWSSVCWRNNSMPCYIGYEKVTPHVSTRVVNPILSPGYFGYHLTSASRSSRQNNGQNPTCAPTSGSVGSVKGLMARVYTSSAANIKMMMNYIRPCISEDRDWFIDSDPDVCTSKPELQNGEGYVLVVPEIVGNRSTGHNGPLGSPIDWWVAWGADVNSDPAPGQQLDGWDPTDTPGVTPPRSNWLMSLGPAIVRQWRNAAATMERA